MSLSLGPRELDIWFFFMQILDNVTFHMPAKFNIYRRCNQSLENGTFGYVWISGDSIWGTHNVLEELSNQQLLVRILDTSYALLRRPF